VGTTQIANASVTAQKIILGGPSELFGSNSTSNTGQNITLDPTTLSMSASGVLSALAAPVPPATTLALGTVQLAGDLGGTGTVATAPVITTNAVTYAKIQKISGADSLLGNSSNASNSNVGEITLGPGLSLSSPAGQLTINPASLPLPLASTTAQGTVILSGLSGTPPSDLTETTPGVPLIAPNAVTYGKIQQVSQAALLGNSVVGPGNVAEITPGPGLSLTATPGQLTLVPSALPPATTSAPGVVTLSGPAGVPTPSDLTETTPGFPIIGTNAVTYPKIQKLVGQDVLLGNSSNVANSNVGEVTLGPGLSLSSPAGQLTINPASIPLPAATTSAMGAVTLSGPAGVPTPSDLTETTAGFPIIGPNVVTYPKIQKSVGAAVLLGNSGPANSNYQEVTLQVGGGLAFTGTALGVNLSTITTGAPLSVAKGGTGAATLTGYLTGNGTGAITGNSTIPATAITPLLVGSVNGMTPATAGGNVSVLIGSVSTGTLAAIPAQPQPNGNIYVVSGDLTPANNGRTFISNGTTWNEVTNNIATTDARYVQLAGSTMNASAVLAFPSTGRVTLAQTTFGATDAITQGAVTTQIAAAVSSGAPNATTSSVGLIQLGSLAFDPSSTATAPVAVKASTTFGAIQLPVSPGTPLTNSLIQGASAGIPLIAPLAVSLGQMANLSANGVLLGSPATGTAAVSQITVGTGLTIAGTTLSVTSAPVVNATSSVLGVITLSNDLSGIPVTTGGTNGPTIGANVVTYPKMQKVVNAQAILGNSLGSANSNVGEVTLSSAFTYTLVGGNQQIGLSPTGLPLATTVAPGAVTLAGLPTSDLTETSPGLPVVANNAITYPKMQQVVGANVLLGNGSGVANSNVQEIAVSSAFTLSGATLGLNPAGLPQATTSSFGTIELGGDLAGTGTTAAVPRITNNAVQYFKLQQSVNPNVVLGAMTSGQNIQELSVGFGLAVGATTLGLAPLAGASQLLGSANNAGPFSVTNISLGSGLIMTGSTLSVGGATPFSTALIPPATTGMAANNYGGIQLNASGPGVLGGTAAMPTLNSNVVSYSNIQQAASGTLMGVASASPSAPGNYGVVTLGPSMSMTGVNGTPATGNVLNSSVSFFSGTNPNTTAPTDRPQTTNVIYMGTDASIWIWNGTTYIKSSINGTTAVQSTTVYTILGSSAAGPPISMTDYNVIVNPGQGVKINYSWNYQSAGGGTAYSPSFGWSGTSPSDLFQSHIPGIFNGGSSPLCTSIFASTPPTQYTLQATNADSNFNQSFTLAIGGLYAPSLAIDVNVYYRNMGVSTVTLTPLFNRDLKTATGVTVQIAGGWMDYTYFP
jgi:hypothetical protein